MYSFSGSGMYLLHAEEGGWLVKVIAACMQEREKICNVIICERNGVKPG